MGNASSSDFRVKEALRAQQQQESAAAAAATDRGYSHPDFQAWMHGQGGQPTAQTAVPGAADTDADIAAAVGRKIVYQAEGPEHRPVQHWYGSMQSAKRKQGASTKS